VIHLIHMDIMLAHYLAMSRSTILTIVTYERTLRDKSTIDHPYLVTAQLSLQVAKTYPQSIS